MTTTTKLLAFAGAQPKLTGAPAYFGRDAAVIGRVTLGADVWLADRAVIRADGHFVRAGDELMLGPRATVHIAHQLFPTLIGERVTVGEYGVVHACTVGDDCVLEDGAIVLDGCVLEAGLVLAPGSLVLPRTTLAGGFLYSGRPARPERRLEAGELSARRERLRSHIRAQAIPPPPREAHAFGPDVFVATTATLRGRIVMGSRAQVWFGCDLDAGDGEIAIGPRSNVQDNSLLACGAGRIAIGADSTVGHNVRLAACTIGNRSLVGIGSVIAADTVIGDDVFVAAGATTRPGQVLDSGLWVGAPARRVGDLDDGKRRLIADSIPVYCKYAAELNRVQQAMQPVAA